DVPVLPLRQAGEALVSWFARAQRPLPWRQAGDPYAVLVSEFMLQQTQVATVVPYFQRFLARFPSLESLARARLDDVLAIWQGLGYYRRARHLHATARLVLQRHGGRIPDDPAVLRTLPGVGPYMAGAIASIAYGRPEPAMDGNAMRVLSRLRLEGAPPVQAAARRRGQWARAMIPEGRAADFTQGLMELGSTICRPTQPLCGTCPVQRFCSAWAYRIQEELPVRRAGSPVPIERVAAAVVVDGAGRVLLVRREEGRLLGSLWALPSVTLRDGESPEEAARRAAAEQAGVEAVVVRPRGETSHAFSHRQWRLQGYLMRPAQEAGTSAAEPAAPYGSPGDGERVRWVAPDALPDVPVGRAFRRVLQLVALQGGAAPMGRAAP
ncbi:MAG: A/G-specific adenine glycosylase, partial [Firmicutes bacterium]|nr:A/G-specific adenine glycosylase [Bacillota bacterium]